jgi:Tfp pilus assembly protein PilO
MTAKLSPKTLAIVLAAVIVVLAAGGWFALVSSQRSKADSLTSQTADAQANLDALNHEEQAAIAAAKKAAAKAHAKGKAKGKSKATTQSSQATLLQLAFPSAVEMPSILLQVERIADRSGVSLDSFAPNTATPANGYAALPINIVVSGRYKQIQRFVHALRVHAGSSHGRVQAAGRLFSVETVGITAASEGLPALNATIVINAFVYSGVAPAAGNADADGSETQTTPAGGTP